VNCGLLVTPVHVDVTPSIVTFVAPVPGDKFPLIEIPDPVAEY
jgi:hypothetical protein